MHVSTVHNIFIFEYKRTVPDPSNYCVQSLLFVENKSDKVYLYGDETDYDIDHIEYLCDLLQFPKSNIFNTPATYETLFHDVINIDETNEHNLENWILSQYRCGYDKIIIRSWLSIPLALEWYNNYLIKKHPFLINVLKLEMESVEWMRKFGNKLMLHRSFYNRNENNQVSICEEYGIDKIDGLKMAKGFYVKNKLELIDCYKYFLDTYQIKNVVIKPVLGVGGQGIVYINNMKQLINYKYPSFDIINPDTFDNFGESNILLLEENLNKTISNKGDWIATFYWSDRSISDPLMQRIVNNKRVGNITYQNQKNCNKLKKILSNIINIIQPNHCGGFDFYHYPLFDDNNFYLVDINTARITASHRLLVLKEKWNKNMVDYINWYQTMSFKYLYKILNNRNVFFNTTTKCGILPISYTESANSKCWNVAIFADNGDQLKQYQTQFHQIKKLKQSKL
eukprot:323791_1